jgi:hypothetical protein
MSIALFSSTMRIALAIAALVLALATWLVVRRGHARAGAVLGIGTLAAVGALAGEGLIALTVRLAAPAAASFNEYRWVFLSPYGRWGLYIGLTAVGAIVALSWRASRGSSAWRRAVLVGLRGAAATAAMVVFLEPAVELRQVAREPNRIAVLIDDSTSMSLAESMQGPTRIERMRRMLAASANTLASWELEHRIDYYTFAETVSATSLAALASDQAVGKATQIRKALEYVRSRYEGRDLAGVVLISDGAATRIRVTARCATSCAHSIRACTRCGLRAMGCVMSRSRMSSPTSSRSCAPWSASRQ